MATRTPSEATLATRAYGKVQRIKRDIAANEERLKKAARKHEDVAMELAEELKAAEAELAKYEVA